MTSDEVARAEAAPMVLWRCLYERIDLDCDGRYLLPPVYVLAAREDDAWNAADDLLQVPEECDAWGFVEARHATAREAAEWEASRKVEAPADVIEGAVAAGLGTHDWEMFEAQQGDVGEAVEVAIRAALEAAAVGSGEPRKPELTDDLVERTARAHHQLSSVYRERGPWDSLPLGWRLNRLYEMRRTLEAALIGAGVAAPAAEWEYGRRHLNSNQVDVLADTPGNIEYQRAQGHDIVRRLKAGPWEPVAVVAARHREPVPTGGGDREAQPVPELGL